MPPLDAATLRAAALEFSQRTSQTFDGIHPRQFSFLSDDALNCLGMLLTACESLGEWPESTRALTVTLFQKAKGGTRPIAIFPAIHRLWTRARRAVADAWECKWARTSFAAN